MKKRDRQTNGSHRGNADRELLDIIFEQYGSALKRFVYSMTRDEADARDALHDTFLRAFENIGERRESGSMGAWLHKIAYHTCLNNFRSEKRRAQLEEEYAEQEQGRAGGSCKAVENALLVKERETMVRSAINRLPQKQRSAIVMFAWNQMKISEIADVMDCSEGTVMSHLHRARTSIRHFVVEQFPEWEMEQ